MKAGAIRKRIGRKLEMRRRRRGFVPKVKSLAKQVAPHRDPRPPIDGPSHHARIEDVEADLRAAIGKLNKKDPRIIIEELDEQSIAPMHRIVSRFILMQLGGWRSEGDNLVHSGGHAIPKGKLDVKEGKLVGPTGKQFFVCESEKLHRIRELLEGDIRLLGLERKYDLFTGLQEAIDGRVEAEG
jgi:hypothetical protein